MSSRGILFGLVLGALTGLFLGEHAAIFAVVADGYVKLLQMTVLPLVVVSLVGGIGSLTHAQTTALGRSLAIILLVIWGLGLLTVCLFPLMFPMTASASFFSTTLVEPPQTFDFLDLYIPANPFRSLADNVVPAVVLFSVLLGIALVGISGRAHVLDACVILRQALSRATGYVARLTPVGLFAIAATTAGTLAFDDFERIQVYVMSYVAISLFVSLWLLPGLIAATTTVPHLSVLRSTRNAMLTAFTTSNLFIVLPMLTDEAKTLARTHGLGERAEAPDVIVPASYNFPHIGKVLTLSFILFAGWFAGAPVAVAEYPHLATTGVMVLFGGVTAAVPFLLDLFRIPADTFQLFLATGVINSRFGTLMAAMHTVTVAIIGTWMTAGAVTLSLRRIVRYAVISLALAVAIVGGIRALVALTVDSSYRGADVLLAMRMLHEQPRGIVVAAPESDPLAAGKPALARMRERGSIRVGVLPDSLPYAFVNRAGELVGLDIELAHKMARELGLRLELVHVTRDRIKDALATGRCEIVMSGVVVTTERAAQMQLSTPYLDETLAMIVPDHARSRFVTWERARQEPSLRIGLPSMAFYVDTVRSELPDATLVPFTTAEEIFAGRQRFDAVMLTAERGSAWTLLHPELSVVVPAPGRVQVPLAYPVADAEMAAFVNVWIDLARKDGTIQSLYNHWILGRTAAPRVPRWSVVRNVLHWVD